MYVKKKKIGIHMYVRKFYSLVMLSSKLTPDIVVCAMVFTFIAYIFASKYCIISFFILFDRKREMYFPLKVAQKLNL